MAKKVYCGFDLGGTKMISLITDSNGKTLASCRLDTPGEQGAEAVLSAICTSIDRSLADLAGTDPKLMGIGMAVPGLIDAKTGTILSLTNLGIQNFAMGAHLGKRYDCPVFLENDVNAGVWGEYRLGAAKGYNHVVGAFVGTGIGGGLILDGRLYRGANGVAGEIGHMIVRAGGALCGCGQHGCLEALSSRLSLSKDAAAMAASGKLGDLTKKTGTDIKKFKSSFFATAYKSGQKDLVKLIDTSARNLGIGMANLVNILDPQAVLLGGGLVEKLGEPYIALVEAAMREHAMPVMAQKVKLLVSSLGDDAVPLGAACLAMEPNQG